MKWEDMTKKHLGHRFRVIHNRIDKYFTGSRKNEKVRLTRAQCATLHYLYDHSKEDVFQKDIEEVFSISGATATNLLKGLERLGMIQRIPLPGDARCKRIELCQKGIKAHERAFSDILFMEETLVKGMTEEEVGILRRLLDRVIQNLEEMEQEKANNF